MVTVAWESEVKDMRVDVVNGRKRRVRKKGRWVDAMVRMRRETARKKGRAWN